jgi:hypothetical protein
MHAWLQTAVWLTVAAASAVYAFLMVYRETAERNTPASSRAPAGSAPKPPSTIPSKPGNPTNSSAARLFRGDSAADSTLHGLAQPKARCSRVKEAEDLSTGCSPVRPEELASAAVPVCARVCLVDFKIQSSIMIWTSDTIRYYQILSQAASVTLAACKSKIIALSVRSAQCVLACANTDAGEQHCGATDCSVKHAFVADR